MDPLHWTVYDENNPNPVVNHIVPNVIKYPVDFKTLPAGDTSLDLTSLTDNCCDSLSMVDNLQWTINFSDTPDPQTPGVWISHPPISGTGQPSTYGSDIELWGDGVFYNDITHTITYQVIDCNGNVSDVLMVNIIIDARPEVIKTDY